MQGGLGRPDQVHAPPRVPQVGEGEQRLQLASADLTTVEQELLEARQGVQERQAALDAAHAAVAEKDRRITNLEVR